ncbi:MAG: hypothetical protein M3237_08500 [Actinomycetota bacterium]|nr:hypothetical protein [Actinomycetota bacterium]
MEQHRRVVWIAAACVVLARLLGTLMPIRADEAGFLLVARSWDPQPDSLYGHFFVDRPPVLIAVIRGVDLLGQPELLRVLGALWFGVLVLVAARVGLEIGGRRAAAWTAVVVAALLVNPVIDVVAIKGEQLGMPFVLLSALCTLVALRRESASLALLAGLCAGIAPGFKQNLVSGLVFAAVVLVGARLAGRLSTKATLRLGSVGVAGALVPAALTIAWAELAGVRMETLWYATFGFRADASLVLADQGSGPRTERALLLLAIAVAAGIALVIGVFLAHLREEWSADRVLTAATLAVVVVEVGAVVAGGSYWRDYLHGLVPGTALCVAQLARRHPAHRPTRVLVLGAVASCVVSLVVWCVITAAGLVPYTEARTGEALAEVAQDGDTLTVFGGRADIQYLAGLPSPYRHLWSLPMRTLDPDLAGLRGVVNGDDPPTWIVEWVDFDAWNGEAGEQLRADVEERYVEHGLGCDDRPVYLLRGLERPELSPSCG